MKLRWIYWDLSKGSPPVGAISIGDKYQPMYQVLQYEDEQQKIAVRSDRTVEGYIEKTWVNVP